MRYLKPIYPYDFEPYVCPVKRRFWLYRVADYLFRNGKYVV